MGRDFSRRSTDAELMDEAGWDFDTFQGCLRDLAQVNVVTLAHRPTLAFLDRLRRDGLLPANRPLQVVDVGSGFGDLLAAIARWARRHEVQVRLIGVDLNPWSARAAAEAWQGEGAPLWVTQNLFDYDGPCDVVVSSLFTHHLADAEVIRFVRWMERSARVGWFVNDLHRHPLPYFGFRLLARLMRWHRFVQHDGPVSIARAFTREDWRGYLREAGLGSMGAEVRRCFPFRICVSRRKAS